MIIRIAHATDVDAIGALWLGLVKYHRALDTAMPVPAEDGLEQYKDRIRRTLDDFNVQVYVAQDEERVVGYILGSIVDLLPDTFEAQTAGMVADIHVDAAHRGRGIGTSLVRAMQNWFRLRGVEYYEWYVAAENSAGVAFWRDKMGGRPIMLRMRAPIDNMEGETDD